MGMNYDVARHLLRRAKDPQKGKPIYNNTRLFERDNGIALRLHQTDVIIYHEDGSVTLDSGGWRTQTTKERLNCYTPGFIREVYQDKREWFIQIEGKGVIPFADGMRVYPDGSVEGYYSFDDVQEDRKLRKKIDKYAKDFADRLPVEMPGPGDCWFCCLRDSDTGVSWGDAAERTDHLLNHIEEEYYVPSLLYDALREKGVLIEGMMLQGCFRNEMYSFETSDYARRNAKRAIVDYMTRRLIDNNFRRKEELTGW